MTSYMPYMVQGERDPNPKSVYQQYKSTIGFESDMAEMVAHGLHCGVEFWNVEDDSYYGSYVRGGKWTGGVGEVLAKRTDFATGHSVTSKRVKVNIGGNVFLSFPKAALK